MSMAQMLLYTHSGWRYVVLLVSAVALLKFVFGWVAKSEWSRFDWWLLTGYAGVITVQWLLGLLLWLTYGLPTASRYWEHILTMTLALVPAHMGLARVRRTDLSAQKYRLATIFVAISTLLLWLGVARITNVF